MLKPLYTSHFKKDVQRAIKRGKAIAKLEAVILCLCEGKPLPARCHDHPLGGDYHSLRDCHIEPDWVLIYQIRKDKLVLVLFRTGSHQELF